VTTGPDDPRHELSELMGSIARSLQERHGDIDATLELITTAAVTAVGGADEASVSYVMGHRRVEARAATGELPRLVDELQTRVGEGPCLDAIGEQSTVRVQDMRTEQRWPRYARGAAELGVGSALCLQLFVEGDTLGALNLYGRRPHAFDAESEDIALVLAAHAAVAVSGAQEEQNLRRAVDSRDLIGQAKGILMERHRLTAEQAFAVLVHASTRTNRKLIEIAEELTTTGVAAGTDLRTA
jgi:GAF domain-containing protein